MIVDVPSMLVLYSTQVLTEKSEMAEDMGISINEVFSFLAEDSVIDLELMEDLNNIDIPSKCSLDDLKNALLKKRLC